LITFFNNHILMHLSMRKSYVFPLGFANESSFKSALLIQHHASLV